MAATPGIAVRMAIARTGKGLPRPERLVRRLLAGDALAASAPAPRRWRTPALPQPAPDCLGLGLQGGIVAARVARPVRRPARAHHARGDVLPVGVAPAFGNEARPHQARLDLLHAAGDFRAVQADPERGRGVYRRSPFQS